MPAILAEAAAAHKSTEVGTMSCHIFVEPTIARDPVTANEFRNLALSLPEATEAAHMGHPDFRVGGKIFATLGHAKGCGMVKLTPDQQAEFVGAEPETFQPVNGGWGQQGATTVTLIGATEDSVGRALATAWRNTAPARLTRPSND